MSNKKVFSVNLFNKNKEKELENDFSGPLDLLLALIDEEKLSINELSLSQVTEQYLDYLHTIEEKQPEELTDFLLVAARLLLLKSKTLLPDISEQEDDELSLEEQLRLYQRFVQVAKKLNKKWLDNKITSFRFEPPRRSSEFVLPTNLGLESMHQSMLKLLERIRPPKPLPQTKIDKGISLKNKIDQIRALLKNNRIVNFQQILQDSKNRTEIIVGFLALLELVKAKDVTLKQNNTFSDIIIENL